ncbi:Alanine dehydrogenase [hydrothermal vent metagenome]|uniref:alanine dehydrogenase n=1 Tax=hydrothermal vent metagenome TaxID=652676 RepID=A0A3B0ZR99_9ZZZZ
MRIGIPKEQKPLEGRVGLTPTAVKTLTESGHEVIVELGAGVHSGYSDNDYSHAGASLMPTAGMVYQSAQLIVKVKEPIEAEWPLLRKDHILFCFLHLAANEALMNKLCDIGLTAIAFETVVEKNSATGELTLPLLAPMSAIAGRVTAQMGATLQYQYRGGQGILFGGLDMGENVGIDSGHVVVIGAGIAGAHAAKTSAALGAQVTVLDINQTRLTQLEQAVDNISGVISNEQSIAETVKQADLLIGAVLIPGAKAPHLVSTALVEQMKPNSVVMDISVDQGGCIETIHPTSYEAPVYFHEKVLHFAVTNIPGAVPRTATQALSAVILSYVESLANLAETENWSTNSQLEAAINVKAGEIVHPALKNSQ